MKRLNIILIAEENQNTVADPFPQELDSQVNILQSMINENPALAEDKQVKDLFEISEKIKADDIASGRVKADGTANVPAVDATPEKGVAGEKKAEVSKEKSPLSALPFFKDDGVSDAKVIDEARIKKLTPESFHELATELGIDPTQDGWVGDTVSKLYQKPVATNGISEFQTKYEELAESINLLPKELQTAVSLHVDGKDWRSSLSNSASIDLSKDFNTLTAEEKIKVHNYYFPDDTIASGEDITKKESSKSIRAAEAKYTSDKYVATENVAKVERERDDRKKNFMSSADVSISEFKKKYPDFKEKDLKAAEEMVKTGGLFGFFFDKSGNLKPDAFKKLIFAQHGENILNVATSIAENRGRSNGKSEILSVEQGVDKTAKGGGGTELTNMEKSVNKLVGESLIAANLTY